MESDEALIERALGGDQRAFEDLVTRYQDTVARFIYKVVPDDEDRLEVCQDVFVKVYFKLDQFRFDARFSTWLYQVAYRSAISFNRKKRLQTVSFDEAVAEKDMYMEPAASDDLDDDAVRRVLDRQLASLKLEERTVVTLHYLQDTSIDEISVIIERPPGTVKSILHRVRKKLNDSLSREAPELKEAMT